MSRRADLGGRGRGPSAGGGEGGYGYTTGYKMNNVKPSAMKNKPFKFNFDSMFDDGDIFKVN